MSPPTPFLTVYDLALSPEEQKVWGELPRTPDTYSRIKDLSAQDSAFVHIVQLLVDRGDGVNAQRYATMIADPTMRRVQLGLLPHVTA